MKIKEIFTKVPRCINESIKKGFKKITKKLKSAFISMCKPIIRITNIIADAINKSIRKFVRDNFNEFMQGQLIYIAKKLCLMLIAGLIILISLSFFFPSCPTPKENIYSKTVLHTIEKADDYITKDNANSFKWISDNGISFCEFNLRFLNYYCDVINHYKYLFYNQFRSLFSVNPIYQCSLPQNPLYRYIIIYDNSGGKVDKKEEMVGDLLTGTQNMIEFIALILGLVTIVFAVLGVKWIKHTKELKEMTDNVRHFLLRGASFTYHGLPDLSKPQVIPDKYKHLLEQWNLLYEDSDLRKEIDKRSEFGCIRFAAALYQASSGYTRRAIDIIEEKIIKDPQIVEPEFLHESYYRLAMLYRGEKRWKDSWEAWDKILLKKEENTKDYAKAVTAFAHMISPGIYKNSDEIDWEKIRQDDQYKYTDKTFVELCSSVFMEIFYGVMLFPGKSYRFFLLPEYLYFLNKLLGKNKDILNWHNLIKEIKDTTNGKTRISDSISGDTIKLIIEDYELDGNSTVGNWLCCFAKKAVERADLYFVPSETDNDFQANLHYCFALMNYYVYDSVSNYSEKAKAKRASEKHLQLSKYHADNSIYIFSEIRQADVSRSDFKQEIDDLINLLK